MTFITLKDFPKDKIYIFLDDKYKRNLFDNILNKLNCNNYYQLSRHINEKFKTKFNGGDVKYWIEGKKLDPRTNKIHPKFMPLWLVLELSRINEEKIEDLQKNIISYRSGNSGLRINKPRLPIKITPESDSIILHLFGDGAAGDFTPSYTQKNKNSFENFIKKLENSFGEFQRSIYFTQGKHQVKFPKAITDILSHYYSINSYMSHNAEIPTKMFRSMKIKNKLACILAFIIDEGSIRDLVVFYNANKILLEQIRNFCLDCEYNCSEIKSYNDYYSFFIKNESIEKFHNDVKKLFKEFSTCNLSFKQDDLDFIIERRKIKKPRNKKITTKIILDSLKEKKLTARQISRLTGYAHCTVIHNLSDLLKEEKVIRRKMENTSYLWNLP